MTAMGLVILGCVLVVLGVAVAFYGIYELERPQVAVSPLAGQPGVHVSEPLPEVFLTGNPHWDDQLPPEIRARLERGEAVRRGELPEGLR